MPKSHNMGRKSRLVQDVELEQNQAGLADEIASSPQPTRPTMHPMQPTKTSSDPPMRHHSRRGD